MRKLGAQKKDIALCSAVIVYLVSLNGIIKILKGLQSIYREPETIPGVYPLQPIKQSVFRSLNWLLGIKSNFSHRLTKSFTSKLHDEHNAFIRALL